MAKRSMTMTESYQASQKFLQKKTTLQNLGEMLKSGKQKKKVEEVQKFDYNGTEYIEPDQDQHIMVAHSKDNVVVLHFSEGIKDLILSGEGLSN